MRKGRLTPRATATLLALVTATAVAAWQPSEALAKPCGDLTAADRTVIVGGAGIGCNFMRNWTKRLMRGSDRRPAGWTCRVRTRDSGGCDRRRGDAFFIYYPPD